ncbi:FAD-dependent oxidoreductase [Shewanella sp. NIFS-20-20]|uniref:FAD-dependent oxidoreductase n=1 Tax=Shewanella sp. NIFS-20-20 TaxID=2853806 RepID=UPI001C44BC69|nr:FAD-dependent oxidoreductase [Shewanella sp. NIFS-20-20]MBV7317367.1 FAD-dependent monooxygenase [Shewanella sp. NIFS-20-20]
MFTTQTYDVAIVGGGMVGLTTAIGLAESGLNVVVIDSAQLKAVSGEPRLRVSAINRCSQQLLANLGAWAYVDQQRLGPYQSMAVWTKNGMGQIEFDADSVQQAQLGDIVENDVLSFALGRRAAELDNLTHLQQHSLLRVSFGEREAWLSLSDQQEVSASLVIAADGAESLVRSQAKIPLTFWDYGHHAMVATIRTELPHQGCARQVFSEQGILALLPLADPHLCSMVWSQAPGVTQALQQARTTEFERTLTAAFDARLGLCQLASERQSFPLRMRYARHFARHRLLLAGDAAHTIHPLAGQGVNLGLLDAAWIIDTLAKLNAAGKDIGEYRHLRALERHRKADAMAMIAAMEAFKQGFSGSHPLKKLVRELGLNLVDSSSGLKTLFIEQAMGQHSRLPAVCLARD